MAATTPYMSLTKWNSSADFFSHAQLAANWDAVDDHDHTSGKGKAIPLGGLAAGAVNANALADDAVTTAKILNSQVTDAKLASVNNGVYRVLTRDTFNFVASSPTGTWFPTGQGYIGASSNESSVIFSQIHLVGADYTVTGKTTRLRVRASCFTNATAPTSTFTVGLYPVTAYTGTAGNLNFTIGAVVTGTTVAFAAPSASTLTHSAASDITIPSDGFYAMGVAISGSSTAANSRVGITTALQIRHT